VPLHPADDSRHRRLREVLEAGQRGHPLGTTVAQGQKRPGLSQVHLRRNGLLPQQDGQAGNDVSQISGQASPCHIIDLHSLAM
jgi:hypothetical protein